MPPTVAAEATWPLAVTVVVWMRPPFDLHGRKRRAGVDALQLPDGVLERLPAREHGIPEAFGVVALDLFADPFERLVGCDLLIAVSFQKLTDPQAPGVASGLLRWQGVVGTDHLIAICYICARP